MKNDQDILIDENDSTNNTTIQNVKSPQSINSPQSTTSQQSSLSNTSQQSNKKTPIKSPLKSSVMESMDHDFLINDFLTALAEYDLFNKSDEQLHKIKELKFNMPCREDIPHLDLKSACKELMKSFNCSLSNRIQ